MPVGIAVAATDALANQLDDPQRIDRRAQPGKQTRRLNHFAGDEPFGPLGPLARRPVVRSSGRPVVLWIGLLRQGGAGVESKDAVAGGAPSRLRLVPHQHVAEHARQHRAMDPFEGPVLGFVASGRQGGALLPRFAQ